MTGISVSSRRQSPCIRWCLVIFAVTSALCVSGPALYWKFKKGAFNNLAHSTSSSCAPCVCNCPPPLSLVQISPGLANLSITGCGENDPDLKNELEKQIVDLLTEELKLLEVVTSEHSQHMNATLGGAKRVATLYQKEAEKCIAATETCEEARERAEASLRKEKKMTLLWEKRAREVGWKSP